MIDAGDSRNNPKLVSCSDLAVLSYISHESVMTWRINLDSTAGVGIFDKSIEIGLDVVCVDPLAFSYILGCMPDFNSVFYDAFILSDITEGELMTCGDIRKKSNLTFSCIHQSSFSYRLKCCRHVVGFIDVYIRRHTIPFSFCKISQVSFGLLIIISNPFVIYLTTIIP